MLAGGSIALRSHGTKATVRAVANTSPELVSNIALSVMEDVVAVGLPALMTLHPIVVLCIAIAFTVVAIFLIRKITRAMRRVFARTAVVDDYSPSIPVDADVKLSGRAGLARSGCRHRPAHRALGFFLENKIAHRSRPHFRPGPGSATRSTCNRPLYDPEGGRSEGEKQPLGSESILLILEARVEAGLDLGELRADNITVCPGRRHHGEAASAENTERLHR
jgi:hypothetical protein